MQIPLLKQETIIIKRCKTIRHYLSSPAIFLNKIIFIKTWRNRGVDLKFLRKNIFMVFLTIRIKYLIFTTGLTNKKNTGYCTCP